MPPAKSRPSNAHAAAGQPLNNRTIANMSRRRANAIASAARATSGSPTDGPSAASPVASAAANGAGVFLCQWGECTRRFHVLGEYAEHVNGEHCRPVNRSGKQCEWAGCWRQDRFTSVNQLMCHVRAHTGEKPFKCTLCDVRFSVRSNYNAHVKARHNRPNLDPEIVDFDPATEPHASASVPAPAAASGELPAVRRAAASASPEKPARAEPTSSPSRKRPTSAAAALLVARSVAVIKGKGKGKGRAAEMEQDQDQTTSEEEEGEEEEEDVHESDDGDGRSTANVFVIEVEVPLARKARRNVVSYEETSDEDDEQAAFDARGHVDSDVEDDLDVSECTSLSGRPRIGFQTSAKDEQEYVASSSAALKRGRRASELSQPSRQTASGRGGTGKRLGKSSGTPSRLDLSSAHKLTALRMGQGDLTADALVPGAPPTPPPSATFNFAKRSPSGTSSRPRRDSLVSSSTRRDSLAGTSTRRDSLTASTSNRRDSLPSTSTRRNSILTSTKKTRPMKCVHREVVLPELHTLRQYKTVVSELEHRLRYLQIIETELLDTRVRLGLAASDPVVEAQLSALRVQIQSTQELLQEQVLPALLAARKIGAISMASTTIGPDGCATPDNPVPTHPSVQKLVHSNADTIGTPTTSSSIHPLYTTPPMTPSLGFLSGSSAVAH